MKQNTEQVFMADVDRTQLIRDFDRNTKKAIDALYQLRAHLNVWSDCPQLISDDAFMATVQELSQAGLLEFLDGQPIDELRLAVTGVAA